MHLAQMYEPHPLEVKFSLIKIKNSQDKTVRIWDLKTKKSVRLLRGTSDGEIEEVDIIF